MFSFLKKKVPEPVVIQSKKIVVHNWTIERLVNIYVDNYKIPVLQVRCKCGQLHNRSLEAIENTKGHCVDCGLEDNKFLPAREFFDQIKIGNTYGTLVVQDIAEMTTKNGKKSKFWLALCTGCNTKQKISKYLMKKRCGNCYGVMGQKFNSLTFISVIKTEFGERARAKGKFKCDCGVVLTTFVSNVKSGNIKSCSSCAKNIRKENMREVSIIGRKTKLSLLEKLKRVESELDHYKSKMK